MLDFLKFLWVGPCTLFGCFLGCISDAEHWEFEEVHYFYGGFLGVFLWIPFVGRVPALAMGSCVLARTSLDLSTWHKHELAHVRQYKKWGLLLPFAYFLSSLYCVLSRKDPYNDNYFEREAFAVSDPR